MHDFFLTDNLQKFKKFIKKKYCNNEELYYNAIKYKSYNILFYIITELNYIEDYFELKKNISDKLIEDIFSFLYQKNSDYLKKIIFKSIKKNNFDNFIQFHNHEKNYFKKKDENYYTIINFNHIESMCIFNRIKFLLYSISNFDFYKHYIFFYLIKYKIFHINLFGKYIDLKLLENFKNINGNYNSFIEFILSQNNYDVFEYIINNFELSLLMINNFNHLSENKLINFINKINISNTRYYQIIDFIDSLLNYQQKFNIIKILDILFSKLYKYCFFTLNEIFENFLAYRFKYYSIFHILCIKSNSIDILDFDIKKYSYYRKILIDEQKNINNSENDISDKNNRVINIKEENIKFNDTLEFEYNEYIPIFLKNCNLEFIKEFLNKYNITNISPNINLLHKHDFYISDYLLNFLTEPQTNGHSLNRDFNFKLILNNIDYLINNYNININDFKCFCPIIRILEFSNYNYDNNFEEYVNFINKNKNKIDFEKNSENIFYEIIQYDIKYIKFILDFLNFDNIEINQNLNETLMKFNLELFLFIKDKFHQNKFNNIINLFNSNSLIIINSQIFDYLIDNNFNFNKIDFTDLKLVNNVFFYFNINLIELIKKLDILVVNETYNNLFNDLCFIINFKPIDIELITKFFKYLNNEQLDAIFIKSCEKSCISLIKYFMDNGKKITFKLIKDYKIDKDKIFLEKDIIGKLTCSICYTNSPSIISLPCGHVVMCNSCFEHYDYKCPYDNIPIDKYFSLKGKNENERFICKNCKKNIITKVYNNCGHTTCDTCIMINNKCKICKKKSKIHKVFLL